MSARAGANTTRAQSPVTTHDALTGPAIRQTPFAGPRFVWGIDV